MNEKAEHEDRRKLVNGLIKSTMEKLVVDLKDGLEPCDAIYIHCSDLIAIANSSSDRVDIVKKINKLITKMSKHITKGL